APGILSTDERSARHYLAQGAQFVAVGMDALLLVHAARTLAARFKGGDAPVAPSSYA
ncbi:MAG TPA: 2-dehydro-3-deoxyglucarate aldolase, partial [Burkholderiaceae bacterium]|nr:2-dehydro-3-deoxyglucarate aldolase [Burkholderiaceae bacterium]